MPSQYMPSPGRHSPVWSSLLLRTFKRQRLSNVEPLTADDVADCVLFVLTRPLHVNVDEIVIKALAQSSGGRIVRSEG